MAYRAAGEKATAGARGGGGVGAGGPHAETRTIEIVLDLCWITGRIAMLGREVS